MTLSRIQITCGISAKARSSDPLDQQTAVIGTHAEYTSENPTVIYTRSFEASAIPASATLALVTGVVTTTGSASVSASGVDFQGKALPNMTRLHAIRIIAPAENADPVALVGTLEEGYLPGSQDLQPGTDMVVKLADMGWIIYATDNLKFIFGTAGDNVLLEVLAGVYLA
jgi:hypothetical protein